MPRLVKAFDHIAFVTDCMDTESFYDRLLVDRMGYKSFSILPNGADPAFDSPSRTVFCEKHGIHEQHVFLCVGDFSGRKNEGFAVDAYRLSEVQNSVLVLIANLKTAYSERLERQWSSKSSPGQRLLVIDRLSKAELVEAYGAAEIFLCGSKWEAQPLAVLDAMMAGVPFISTDVGCVREFPGGCVVRDRTGMARAIAELAIDPNKRGQLAAEGRRACDTTYNWKRIIAAVHKLCLSLSR
jgi:glycosyltransferase involved in cell wall biosynthesis